MITVFVLLVLSEVSFVSASGEIEFRYNGSGGSRRLVGVASLISNTEQCGFPKTVVGKIQEISSYEQSNFPVAIEFVASGNNYSLRFEPNLESRFPAATRQPFLDLLDSEKDFRVSYAQCQMDGTSGLFVNAIEEAGAIITPPIKPTPSPKPPISSNSVCAPVSLDLANFKANPVVRNKTLKVYSTYRADRERIIKQKLSDSQIYTERLQALEQLDLDGVDPDLVKFFENLKTEFSAVAEIFKQAEREAGVTNATQGILQGMVENDVEESDNPLLGLAADLFFSPIYKSQNVMIKARYVPPVLKAQTANEDESAFVLARLLQKYNFDFYKPVFEKPVPMASKIGTSPKTNCQGFKGQKQFTITTLTQTGLQVCAGDRVRFLAGGSIILGRQAGASAPDGVEFGSTYNHVTNAPHGALLYGIADKEDNGAIQLAGFGADFIAKSAGQLMFIVNDKDVSNNIGNYTVDVQISCPESYRK